MSEFFLVICNYALDLTKKAIRARVSLTMAEAKPVIQLRIGLKVTIWKSLNQPQG